MGDVGGLLVVRADDVRVVGDAGRDEHRDAGERADGVVVLVAAEDDPDVGAVEDLREVLGVLQAEGLVQERRRGDRRVVEHDDRAVRHGLAGQRRPESLERGVAQRAVARSGDARVDRHHAEARDDGLTGDRHGRRRVLHRVRERGATLAQDVAVREDLAEALAEVVVAGHQHERCPVTLGPRADALAGGAVRLGAAVLGDVPRDHDQADTGDAVDVGEHRVEGRRRVDGPLVQGAVAGQVGVGQVEDPEAPGCWRLHAAHGSRGGDPGSGRRVSVAW